MKQYQNRTLEKLAESFDEGPEPKWPFLSNFHKPVVLTKIELLRKLQGSTAAELLDNIASHAKDTEIAELASQAASELKRL